MAMVDVFLLTLLQLANRRQWGKQDHTKGGITTITNTTHQHKHANNKTKRRVEKYCSPSKAMVMVNVLLLALLQPTQDNA
jgi:oligoribonuclease (3'-5' exoribonuclease)